MINEERLVRTFCDLVRIDSPSDEEEEMAQELSRRLSALGFRPERDAHGNLIASEDGDNPLLLSAHMDTVEPGRGSSPGWRETGWSPTAPLSWGATARPGWQPSSRPWSR
ncbi:MAG: hypothetical protein IIC81_05345 [Chloroflexi bacterium]|nr:hypothetical protein [Chloroflexota bacterium]